MSHLTELPAPVVFFTGAGISVGAGLPTYRGTGGLYETGNRQPPNADDATSERLPALWERFRPRLRAYDELRPALAHRAIAELESSMPGGVTVVTQNVDGLHSLAGSSRVIELHGSLRSVRCLDHQHVHQLDDAEWVDGDVPRCPTCGAVCRPNIVLFGESLPPRAFEDADVEMRRAQSIVAVGTSAVVYPAAFLIGAAYTEGATCVWINPETPPPDSTWSWRRGSADAEIGALLAGL